LSMNKLLRKVISVTPVSIRKKPHGKESLQAKLFSEGAIWQ
jgi:hypothetical protein